ncbi:MAG: hypothetical protein Q4D37_09445, partial [Oscillospiraceae bacterium]|nr:hypothetical protein [Oscillospiraceae bacterium]
MKKVTKLVSFCAAVTMAVTAIPASSLILAKAAADDTTPTIEVGTQFVEAGEEWATAIKPEIYNGGDFITEGLSLAFKVGSAADPATAALMEAWTYEDLDSSAAFNDLGSWKVNKDEMIWADLTNGTSKIDVGKLTDGMNPFELYYTIPDEATVNKIAKENKMEIHESNDEDGMYYYEFPLQFAPDKINSEGGSALLWATENNTVIEANYVDGSVCVKVKTPYEDPITTTTTTTNDSTTTTTTTVTTTTTSGTTTTIGDEPTIKVGQQFVKAEEEWATAIKPEIYNAPETW